MSIWHSGKDILSLFHFEEGPCKLDEANIWLFFVKLGLKVGEMANKHPLARDKLIVKRQHERRQEVHKNRSVKAITSFTRVAV